MRSFRFLVIMLRAGTIESPRGGESRCTPDGPNRFARVLRPAARRGSAGPRAAGPVCHAGLSGPLCGPDAAHSARSVDVRSSRQCHATATQRSYSIASAPSSRCLELTIERLDDGEASPYLAGIVQPGDVFEVRGPIGGYFIWLPQSRRPLALIAGGSGIVPLMAMLRLRAMLDDAPAGTPALLGAVIRRRDLWWGATELVAIGHLPAAIRTERFGPSGTI